MADPRPITIPLELPGDEAMALGQLLKRIDYDTCGRLTDPRIVYDNNRSECDVAWCAVTMLRRQLAEAGFAPG
jgi:hypothetical protein